MVAALESTDGIESVSFVTHSLGGIVTRDLLGRDAPWRKRIRVHRFVMLAPPNRGSIAADAVRDWMPYRWLMGAVGQEVTTAEIAKVPIPQCEFGIIAGGKGKAGYNPLLPGDDDGVVTVENTKLEGARDFLRVQSSHTFIMNHAETRRAVLRFLKSGSFAPRDPQADSAPNGSE